MKWGDHTYYKDLYKNVIKEQSELKFKDKLKILLSMPLSELKGTPIYDTIQNLYPNLPEEATLDEARMIKLFDKVFKESSQKALELTYKLDGSMADITVDINFDEIDDNLEGIK